MKNEELQVDIVDYGSNFEGIAKHNNKVIFVPQVLHGEKVDIKIIKETSSYSIGKKLNILKESKRRAEPFCDVYTRCGGCSAQHIEYLEQLKIKKNNVKVLLDKYKVEYGTLKNTIGQGLPYYYRNKVQYPVSVDKDGKNIMGFYSKNSNNIIENSCCYIQDRVIDMLAKAIFDILDKEGLKGYNRQTFQGDIRHILIRRGYHTGEVMVVLIINNKDIFDEKSFVKITNKIIALNSNIKSVFLNLNESKTNEILGDKLLKLYGEDYILDKIGDYKFYISPKSFFQVNTLQAEMLYETLKKNLKLKKDEVLFDLYSGVGSIGIFLSDSVKSVHGIEIEKTAVDMANLNLQINDVKNASYIAGDVKDKIVEFKKENIKPDVIVVDPPRKGLDEKSIEYILEFNPSKIGYVSCNPSTMVRDLKLLSNKYEVVSITPVDMFPHTAASECVCVLNIKESTEK